MRPERSNDLAGNPGTTRERRVSQIAQSRFFHPDYASRRKVPQVSDVERGLQAGAGIGKALEGISGAIQQAKQDKIANQLLAQSYPGQPGSPNFDPNADLSTDLPESVGTDIGGTATQPIPGNFQGGAAELKARQSFQKESLGTELQKAQIANYLAEAQGTGKYAKRALPVKTGVTVGGGSSSRWLEGDTGDQTGYNQPGQRGVSKSNKPAPYAGGSGDVENDEGTDNFDQIRTDFDQQHGKGTFDAFQAQSGGTKNDDGSYSVNNKSGDPIATVQSSDVPLWMQRVNAARVKRNQQPIGPLGTGQNPVSTAPAGSAANPVVAQSKLHVRSLPFGTYVYDPDTKQSFIKQKPAGQ